MNDLQLVVQMIAWMEQHLTEPMTLESLAEKAGYSENRFRQKFYNVTSDTPSGYLRKRRLTEAAKEILSGKRSLDISLDYGYSNQENFITAFRGYFGVTPAELFAMDAKFKRFYSRFREVLNIMEIANLQQPPLSSTDMGCMKGASDYFDNDLSTAMIYGLSGYGYMMNIHKELCPSGPYVWNRDKYYALLRDLGVDFQRGYEMKKTDSPERRLAVETELKDYLNKGNLCVLGFLESQLFSGYDEEGFMFLSPWKDCDSTISRLTFGSWEECLEREGWVIFAVFSPNEKRIDPLKSIKNSWKYGLELYRTPEKHQCEGYGINHQALANWKECVKQDMGGSHGNWWNGMVWTECRRMMADFYREQVGLFDSPAVDEQLLTMSELSGRAGDLLDKIKEKELDKDSKLILLEELSGVEKETEAGLEKLINLAS